VLAHPDLGCGDVGCDRAHPDKPVTDYSAGDEVRVFYWSGRRARQYPAGFPGKVTKTGKKYGTAEFDEPWPAPDNPQRTRPCEVRFDLETGFQSPDSLGLRVRTTEGLDRDERRREALWRIKGAGIEFSFGRERSLTLEQVESLAEVVKG
jgi:hypothetical protein